MLVNPFHEQCPPVWYKKSEGTKKAIVLLEWLFWIGWYARIDWDMAEGPSIYDEIVI